MTHQDIQIPRNLMRGALIHARNLGFYPRTVIDVGAGLGTFEIYGTFPKARHFLIEPIEENRPYLEKICTILENAEYAIAAATKVSGMVTIGVNPNLVHSSIVAGVEEGHENLDFRTVPGITLDELCRERKLSAPYLIKVDVDGKELDVLSGATQILKNTEYVLVEVTLFGQMYEVMNFMKEQEFAVYDIVDPGYRPTDGALSQVDMAFVKESGQFRKSNAYVSTKEQEAKLIARLKAYREGLIAHIDRLYQPQQEVGEDTRAIADNKSNDYFIF